MTTSRTFGGAPRSTFWYAVGLAVVTLALFWPLTKYGFVNFDDDQYVTANPRVQHGLTLQSVKWAFTSGYASNWHPVTWLSHMLDCQLFGVRNAGAMHLVNLLFHAANAVLLFLLLRRATEAEGRSACVAALFAVHPLHVESVAWIAERKDVLSTLFWLLATWQYLNYAAKGRRIGYWFSLFFFAIGLMAKPMLVTLPVTLLLLDYWPLARFSRKNLKALLLEKLPFFGLALVSSLVTFLVQKQVAVVTMEQLSLYRRLAHAAVSYLAYLGKTAWPSELVFFYPHPIVYPLWQVIGTVAGLVLISWAALVLRQRRPYLIFGWAWFLVTLLPVIGLVQVGAQAMADRYTYVPLIGIFVALIWGANDCLISVSNRWRYVAAASGIAILSGCVLVTRHQLGYWKDGVTLFEHGLAFTRKNLVANINIGAAYMREGRRTEALEHYLAALRIKADNATAQYNLGVTLASLGRTDEALKHYRIALELDPSYAKNLKALGDSLLTSGKTSEALMHYKSLLQIDRRNAEVHFLIGNILVSTGDLAGGIESLQEAAKLEPGRFEAQLNLANALTTQGKMEEAMEHYEKALAINPDSALAHYEFGNALFHGKRGVEAIRELRIALRLSPDAILTLDKLAWILSTTADPSLRDGQEAVRLAERACQITGNTNPVTLATLSAAYAEAGDFERASATAQKSKALANGDNAPKLIPLLERQIESYAARRPFRDS